MTVLIQYDHLPNGDMEPLRVVADERYLKFTSNAGTQVLVNPRGETIMPTSELGQEYKIKGEVRFG